MSDVSPRLALPLILPDQAQKHVTHNEAIDRLDVIVQLAVEQFNAATPPADPAEGAIWALGSSPTGAWAGQDLKLASWRNGAWIFVAPQIGWRGWGKGGAVLRVFTGSGWASTLSDSDLQNLGGVGINTGSDAVNRLAVSAPATLLTHEGAGHQLKINKAAAAQTASLLFQTDWSGRAEMGLAGSDDFAIRVSPDGTGFATGLSVAAASGLVTAPAGLRVADGTAASPGLGFAADSDTGLTRPAANQIGLVTGGTQRALLSTSALQVTVPITGTAVQQSASDTTAGRLMRADYGFSRGNLLGSVAQSAGVPTGAAIERGSNASGEYVRFADGTQICSGSVTASLSIVNALAGGFRSGGVTPTFAAAFVAVPKVAASCEGLSAFGVLVNGITLYGVTLCFTAVTSQGTAADRSASYIAFGRWF